MSEKALQAQAIELATLFNFLVYHTWISIRSAAGFPDLVLCRGAYGDRAGRTIFVEVKREGGSLTPAQLHWMRILEQAGNECYVLKPGGLQAFAVILQADQRPTSSELAALSRGRGE